MSNRAVWTLVLVVATTGGASVVGALMLGTSSSQTISLLQISLTPSGFLSNVSPGGMYYFNITAASSYHVDMTGVFIVATVNDSCADLASRGSLLAEKSAAFGGYSALGGRDSSGSCTFVNVAMTATVPTGGAPVIYWFRESFTSVLPDLTWSFQAARQN
jgi:hypothetical protein